MKRALSLVLIMLVFLLAFPVAASAHPGGTDSSGGHRDSATGLYHYHCGGYPAHSHAGGSCPYASGGSSAGTLIGTLLGPLLVFGIVWLIGRKKESKKTQKIAIQGLIWVEVTLIFGALLALISFAIYHAIRFILRKRRAKKEEEALKEEALRQEPQKSEREKFVDTFYNIIDATWANADDQALYHRFQSFKPKIKQALSQSYDNMANIPRYHEDRHTFDEFALFQCFSLSFVLTLDLQPHFSKYSPNDVTNNMSAVFAENGYFTLENGLLTNRIPLMVTKQKSIVRATLKKCKKFEKACKKEQKKL